MTRHWCTYSDSAYLPRLKALYASMVRHCGDFRLHVLAWDDKVMDWASDVNEHGPLSMSIGEFVREYPEFAADRLPGAARSRVEHMWTCGPGFILDLMEETGSPVTYIDADCFFHSSPEPMFDEIGDAPAGIVPHNFQPQSAGLPGPSMETHWPFGLYNVGIVHIADKRIAEDWAERCRQWCYERLDLDNSTTPPMPIFTDGILRYGDQAYLTDWPQRFGARVLHPSTNVGPWSVHTMALRRAHDGAIFFGGRRLISYHYSGYRELPDGHTVMSRPEYMLTREQIDILYGPYNLALEEAKR